MAAIAITTNSEPNFSKTRVWTGRTISILVTLFLLVDAVMKIIKDPHVLAACADLGFSPNQIVLIGAILLFCTALYVFPRTATLGAILVTGYLGGAVASQLRIGHDVFQCIFPILFASLAWGALYLRNPRLAPFLPQGR